jgi:hypothetical protein
MDDFERIPVRVKYIGGIVSRIVERTILEERFDVLPADHDGGQIVEWLTVPPAPSAWGRSLCARTSEPAFPCGRSPGQSL